MKRYTRNAALCLVAVLLLPACATRGALRNAVEAERAAWSAAIEAERSARTAADERLAAETTAEINALRSDLQALRTEFNAQIEVVAEGLRFMLPVHFAFDDATIRPEAAAALQRFADVAGRHYAGALVTVEGFADPAGPPSYNIALSTRRAEAVRDYLIERGAGVQLRVIGFGEERPVVPGAAKDDPGAELNRRVVFVIETPSIDRAVIMEEAVD
jgi:outer membrane protein OmpA-like peptidoglycan-associated protein